MQKANICGLRVRSARESKGLDQTELSEILKSDYKLNLHQSDISEIERQVRGVRDFEIDLIAKALGVQVGWLISGKDQ